MMVKDSGHDMRVYYYFDPERKGNDAVEGNFDVLDDILKNRRIKICSVSRANDPFDFQVSFDCTISQSYVRGFRNAFKRLKEKFGIVCFSESVDNVLMWSHYADKHQGLVLGLDVNENMLTQVDYLPIAPRIIPNRGKCKACPYGYTGVMRSVMRTKAIDWAYEKEWRLILNYSEVQNIQVGKSEDGAVSARYYLLPPTSIQSLYIGVRCELKLVDVFSLLHKHGLDQVGVYKMVQSFDGYSLSASCLGTYEKHQERIKLYLNRMIKQIRN